MIPSSSFLVPHKLTVIVRNSCDTYLSRVNSFGAPVIDEDVVNPSKEPVSVKSSESVVGFLPLFGSIP